MHRVITSVSELAFLKKGSIISFALIDRDFAHLISGNPKYIKINGEHFCNHYGDKSTGTTAYGALEIWSYLMDRGEFIIHEGDYIEIT